jgi:predicted DNA-binding protein
MPFSLRLDADTEAKIRRLAAATRRSKSEVVREAVAHYAPEAETEAARGQSAFDRLKPFIGSVTTGGANLSKDTHAKYRKLLRRKHGGRRPR